MDYKREFYDKYVSAHTGHIYGDISLEDMRRQFEFNNSYFLKLLPRSKTASILDIGCGNGSFVYWLQANGFSAAEGVDISSEQIEQGKALGIKNIHKEDFKDFLKVHTGRYDAIIARDVLEHLNKAEVIEMLALVRGALKEEGVFISQTVNAENVMWGRLRHADFTHDLAFTRQSMKQLLLVSGFGNIEVLPQRPVVHGLLSFLRRAAWQCIELFLQAYLLIETGSKEGIFTQNIITRADKH